MSFHRLFAALVMPFHYAPMLHFCQLFTIRPSPWVLLQPPCHFPSTKYYGLSLLLCQLVNCHLILATLVTTPARPYSTIP
ncbi:hypothetical protein H4582DRAFT_1918758, partial [Lactarius indigo]